jgi:hypothetical protein
MIIHSQTKGIAKGIACEFRFEAARDHRRPRHGSVPPAVHEPVARSDRRADLLGRQEAADVVA